MCKYFYLDESTIHRGKYCLRINGDCSEWHMGGRANFNILPARVLDISYPEYLKFCRDELGAYLCGKNECSVPYLLFQNNKATQEFVEFLNDVTEHCKSNG